MARAKAPRLYPFAPLAEAAKRKADDDMIRGGAYKALRISSTQWGSFQREGLTERQADRLACRIGLHPASVWPEYFDKEGTAIFERLRKQLAGTHWAPS